jgi:hypothetical protein
MRRLERGAGRKVGTGDAVPNSGSRRPAIPGLGLGRRPRVSLASSHSGGVGAPPGGTMASCQELADGGARAPQKARPDAVRKTPQQSAERRAAGRSRPHLRRSGDRRDREARHGCGVPRQRLSALCSPSFFWGAEKDEGHPAPFPNRSMARGCLTIKDAGNERAAYSLAPRSGERVPSECEAGEGLCVWRDAPHPAHRSAVRHPLPASGERERRRALGSRPSPEAGSRPLPFEYSPIRGKSLTPC